MKGIKRSIGALVGALAATVSMAGDSNSHLTAAQKKLPEYIMLVFSKPTAGQEVEFNRWYTDQHVGDLLKVPGIVAGQRFKQALDLSSPAIIPPYLVIFDYRTADLEGLSRESVRRMQQKVYVPSDAMDYGSLASANYRPLGPTVYAKPSPHRPGTKPYIMIALSNPAPGQEAEYNRWYDQQHVPDVLKALGMKSARRFVRVKTVSQVTRELPGYLVRYDLETDDPIKVREEIMARIKDGRTKMSPAFDNEGAITRIYEPMMPVMHQKP